MTTFKTHRLLELFFADLTSVFNLVFIKLFLELELLNVVWVVDFLPSLSFLLFVVFLELPASFIVSTIVDVQTAVTENTITTIMPVFTQFRIVVETAADSNIGWSS